MKEQLPKVSGRITRPVAIVVLLVGAGAIGAAAALAIDGSDEPTRFQQLAERPGERSEERHERGDESHEEGDGSHEHGESGPGFGRGGGGFGFGLGPGGRGGRGGNFDFDGLRKGFEACSDELRDVLPEPFNHRQERFDER